MLCNNCKNKDVCKYYDTMKVHYEYVIKIDKNVPIKMKIECDLRRVECA